MSAFEGKADILDAHCKCPLMTQSGHQPGNCGTGNDKSWRLSPPVARPDWWCHCVTDPSATPFAHELHYIVQRSRPCGSLATVGDWV
jgi:hypothetical protein